MAAANLLKKGSLLIPSGTFHDPDKKHLHIICTDPDKDGKQLIVSVSSRTNAPCDETCLLHPHEHAFLKRESYVFYSKAKIIEHSSLVNGVTARLFIPKDDVNGQTFLKITQGICNSIQTPKKIKEYFGCDMQIAKDE